MSTLGFEVLEHRFTALILDDGSGSPGWSLTVGFKLASGQPSSRSWASLTLDQVSELRAQFEKANKVLVNPDLGTVGGLEFIG